MDSNEAGMIKSLVHGSPGKTVAEYFAGIGLVRLGLEQKGWKVTFANDISSKKYEMYKGFFPDQDDYYVVGDIFDLDVQKIPRTTLATCSFPCVDLSLAGNMNGIDGKHSSAFWGFIKILETQGDSSPDIVLVENVPGWLHSNTGKDFRLTIQALNRAGYACDVFTLDARRFTPQSRPRVFVVGVKQRRDDRAPDLIIKRSKSLISDAIKKEVEENRDLDWFYNEIPVPPELNTSGLSGIVESLRLNDSRWWPDNEVKRHIEMMKEDHRQMVLVLAAGKKQIYRTFYRRRRDGFQRAEVRKDDLSGCLRTAVGGSGKQFLVMAGNGIIKMRAMTPREYARLQGVPDKYPIKTNGVQALTGFGDAVCVPAFAWIAENVLNPLFDDLRICQAESGT